MQKKLFLYFALIVGFVITMRGWAMMADAGGTLDEFANEATAALIVLVPGIIITIASIIFLFKEHKKS